MAMKPLTRQRALRGLTALGGFLLFFAPFALAQRLLIGVFGIVGRTDIHGDCFRMALSYLFQGKGLAVFTTTGILFVVVFTVAFFFGPLFCGKVCTAGALPEFLSRLVPKPLRRFQVALQEHIPPAPVRYGTLVGYLVAPALGLSVICAYCQYSIVERFALGGLVLDWGVLSSTFVLTVFLWLFVLGLFVRNGRGYCTYLCPIGAAQSLVHRVGSLLPFTFKIRLDRSRCSGCASCARACPAGALQTSSRTLRYGLDHCLACHDCLKVCPCRALSYGLGPSGWAIPRAAAPTLEASDGTAGPR